MIDSIWRKKLQPYFDAPAKLCVHLKIKPNAITISAFIIGIGCGLSIALARPWTALVLLVLSGFLDIIDGSVARLLGKSSKFGAFLDLVLDKMVESAVILGFVFLLPQYYLAYILFFIAVLFNYSTFVVAGTLIKNTGSKSMHYDAGIAERTETFIVFGAMIVFNNYVYQILMIFNLIIFITGIIRFIKVYRLDKQT